MTSFRLFATLIAGLLVSSLVVALLPEPDLPIIRTLNTFVYILLNKKFLIIIIVYVVKFKIIIADYAWYLGLF